MSGIMQGRTTSWCAPPGSRFAGTPARGRRSGCHALLQLGGHAGHGGAELGADRGERDDGGNRNQRGDETVLDGSRTTVVLHQLLEQGQHRKRSSKVTGARRAKKM